MREVAEEERVDLGLGTFDPLDPYELSRAHGIPIYSIASFEGAGPSVAALQHFRNDGSGVWSAMLIPLGTARVIVENDSHHLVRRRSNIAHELGHHLLEHEFDEVIFGEDHKRIFDAKQEKQATFISGELLIPLKACKRMAYDKWGNTRVAEAFGVSEQFAQMRMSGPRVIAARAEAKFGRR